MKVASQFCGRLAALALTCLVAGTANASVAYSQAFNTLGGFFSDANQRQADRFSIASGATVSAVTWWGNSVTPGPFASFTVSFYADTGSGPGALLSSDIVTATTLNTHATDAWGDILEFSADISDFNAAAGAAYYFSVVETVTNNFLWSRTNGTVDGLMSFSNGPWIVPTPAAVSTAYALLTSEQSVPEPGSALLVVLALAAVLATRRRYGD